MVANNPLSPFLRCQNWACNRPAKWAISPVKDGVIGPDWRALCGVHVRPHKTVSWFHVGPMDPVRYATKLAAQVAEDAERAQREAEAREQRRLAAEEKQRKRIAEAYEAETAEWMWVREERAGFGDEPPTVYYSVVRAGHPVSAFSSVRIENEAGMPPRIVWPSGSWPAAAAVAYADAIKAAVAEARGESAAK